MKRPTNKQQLPSFITERRSLKPLSRKKKAALPSLKPGSDYGSPYLGTHHQLVEENREFARNGTPITKGLRVIDQLPIDRYYTRHEFAPRPDSVKNAALYQAAKKLKDDFQASGLMEAGRTQLERIGCASGSPDRAMTMHIASLTAYNRAIMAISPSLSPILRHVVCYDGTARE